MSPARHPMDRHRTTAMSHPIDESPHSRPTSASSNARRVAATAAIVGLMIVTAPARAVDGCLVLLCLAAPSWRSIAQCVPPIRQLFRDLARGEVFPTCGMAGLGNSAGHAWASAPGNCPPQYTHVHRGLNYTCDYTGAVSVSIDGALFSRTWWRMNGDTVTDFSPAAKARLGDWDTQFDRDYARWQEAQEAEQDYFLTGRTVSWTRLPSSH